MDSDESSSWITSKRALFIIVLSATALANQYGFWRIFHVAILEHIGITDLPRLASWPLISALYSTVIGVAFAAVINPPPEAGGKRADPSNPVARTLLRHRISIGLILMALGFVMAFAAEPRVSATTAPMLIGTGISIRLTGDLRIPEFGVNVTPFILGWSVIVLGIAYGNGVASAIDIREGKNFLQATFPQQPNESLRYLARVGDHVLLYDPTKQSAILYELKAVEPLTLTFTSSTSVGPAASKSDRSTPLTVAPKKSGT